MAEKDIGTEPGNPDLEQPAADVLEQQHGLSTTEPGQNQAEQGDVAEADAMEQDTPVDQDDGEGWAEDEDRRMEA